MPDISISVNDNDGQFLLIEAADYLPDWLGPENASNRVWLRQGQIITIPLDEPGRKRDGSIELDAALCFLRKISPSSLRNSPDYSWNKKMNEHIFDKTLKVYPARIVAQEHVAACILPKFAADLLAQHPQLISLIVTSFCNSNISSCFQPKRTKSASNSSQPKLNVLDGSLGDCRSLSAVPVQFTRALYAKMSFQKFRMPRKYHSLQRLIATSGSKKVIAAFDLGCRICVGIEEAFLKEASYQLGSGNSDKWTTFLTNATNSGIISNLDGAKDSSILVQLTDLYHSRALLFLPNVEVTESITALSLVFESTYGVSLENCSSLKVSPFLSQLHEFDFNQCELLSEAKLSIFLNEEIFRNILKGTIRSDSDSWLFMTPEELDEEMNNRMRAAGGTVPPPTDLPEHCDFSDDAPGTGSAAGATGGGANETKQMQDIVDGIKSFMSGKSDFDGVRIEKKKRSTMPAEKVAEDDLSGLDFDYMANVLNGTTANNDDASSDDDSDSEMGSEDSYDSEDSHPREDDVQQQQQQQTSGSSQQSARAGLAQFTLSHPFQESSSMRDSVAVMDSDDEETEEGNDNHRTIADYQVKRKLTLNVMLLLLLL